MKLLPNEIKKIAVFRALQLGDMLCVIPAIRALRHAYPDAEIYLLGLPWACAYTQRFNDYFDGFIHFPGYPGLPEQAFDARTFADFLPLIQQMEFDLVLQMQGNGSVINPLMELFGARHVAGFSTEGHYAPENSLFMPYPNYGSEIRRHLLLMEHLGFEPMGTELEFPLSSADREELEGLDMNFLPKKYVCIHPGSRGAWRQWPVQYFAMLGNYCAEQGYEVLVTGTNDEQDIVTSVINHVDFEAIDMAGKTSLGAMGVLINDAAMLISNCTGVSHIAAALKTPSIVLSMDGEPERWGPIDKLTHRTINWLQTPDFNLVFNETVDLMQQIA
ncbi:glycosyltransferase family 9 protein [Mucilaginibacter auburnensis]|uniref:ADP-heptose:LPS heptosyltransferase n=1 Tax=Mucilaginibacter auburnensis TaxID=1457233 RepID=A0A2H9VW76_9SPHI|nr:glycosyltransferase family 9 protein [Mucilaginibacter auburnensis]PJJ85042.1 ADP-heptose:LPS heptosyltransferase [Mucilaginibacter auburnensis]